MPHMTEDQLEALQGKGDTEAALDAESAVAVDPGTTTGVAISYADRELHTRTTDFWTLLKMTSTKTSPSIWQLRDVVYIVEAPYKTGWGKTQQGPRAYSSGKVAREAELLVEGLNRRGHDVIEHDPRHDGGDWSGKWNSKLAHHIVGGWEGPDNEHTRDALKLLTLYGFAG